MSNRMVRTVTGFMRSLRNSRRMHRPEKMTWRQSPEHHPCVKPSNDSGPSVFHGDGHTCGEHVLIIDSEE